jgi:hypothetical protein
VLGSPPSEVTSSFSKSIFIAFAPTEEKEFAPKAGEDMVEEVMKRLLSVSVTTPAGELEVHSAYIPPGSSHGLIKVKTFEAIYRRLARSCDRARVLCGDFNAPQEERIDGTVVTWGQPSAREAQ